MAKARRFMERRIPLDITPEGVDVDPRPIDLKKAREAYPEV